MFEEDYSQGGHVESVVANGSVVVNPEDVNKYVVKVFGWMFFGLLVTALTTAFIVAGMTFSDAFAAWVMQAMNFVFVLFLAELFLVGFLSFRIAKMQPATAKLLYVLYAVANGVTVGLIGILYAGSTVVIAFGITAFCFGAMALYGHFTGADLTQAGKLFMMGLVGLIVLSLVNIFLKNSGLDFIICIVGLFVFLGLIAYDTQKIKGMYYSVCAGDNPAMAENMAIVAALSLYLDFINLFFYILRILGGRRN